MQLSKEELDIMRKEYMSETVYMNGYEWATRCSKESWHVRELVLKVSDAPGMKLWLMGWEDGIGDALDDANEVI